jgi:uncharacterized membrane protein
MEYFSSFYIALGLLIPIFGLVVTIIFLYILNRIAKELQRMNDLKEKETKSL